MIDPSQGLDTGVDLAIDGGVVAALGANLRGRLVLDATGCVVAPGFVDLHSHAQSVGGHRLQAFDGVTTTLELEAGAMPVGAAYAQAGVEGRPLNYGYSASWAAARIGVLAGGRGDGRATMVSRLADPAWQREATAAEEDRIVALLETELAAGAHVVLTDLDGRVADVAEELNGRHDGRTSGIVMDVTDEKSVVEAFRRAVQNYGTFLMNYVVPHQKSQKRKGL